MHRLLLLSLLVGSSFHVCAQYVEENEQQSVRSDSRRDADTDPRWFFGGGAGMLFSNPTIVSVSPRALYRIVGDWYGGLGYTYMYYRETLPGFIFESQTHGPGIFSMFAFDSPLFSSPLYQLYVGAEYEYWWTDHFVGHRTVNQLLIGGGLLVRQGRGFGTIGLYYNLLYDPNTPLFPSTLLLRFGVYF